jgi:hypothetical protein
MEMAMSKDQEPDQSYSGPLLRLWEIYRHMTNEGDTTCLVGRWYGLGVALNEAAEQESLVHETDVGSAQASSEETNS